MTLTIKKVLLSFKNRIGNKSSFIGVYMYYRYVGSEIWYFNTAFVSKEGSDEHVHKRNLDRVFDIHTHTGIMDLD